jgi:hypothetical protein
MIRKVVIPRGGQYRLLAALSPAQSRHGFEIFDGENSGGEDASKSSTLKTKIGAEAGGSSTDFHCPAG